MDPSPPRISFVPLQEHPLTSRFGEHSELQEVIEFSELQEVVEHCRQSREDEQDEGKLLESAIAFMIDGDIEDGGYEEFLGKHPDILGCSFVV